MKSPIETLKSVPGKVRSLWQVKGSDFPAPVQNTSRGRGSALVPVPSVNQMHVGQIKNELASIGENTRLFLAYISLLDPSSQHLLLNLAPFSVRSMLEALEYAVRVDNRLRFTENGALAASIAHSVEDVGEERIEAFDFEEQSFSLADAERLVSQR